MTAGCRFLAGLALLTALTAGAARAQSGTWPGDTAPHAPQHPRILMDTAMATAIAARWQRQADTTLVCAYGSPAIRDVVTVDSIRVVPTCVLGRPNGIMGFVRGYDESDEPALVEGMKRLLAVRPALTFACEVWAITRAHLYGVWMDVPRSACAISERAPSPASQT